VAAAGAATGGRDDHGQLVGRVEQRPAHDERNAATGVDEIRGHARSIRVRRSFVAGCNGLGRRAEWTWGLDMIAAGRQITVRERLPRPH